MQAFMLVFFTKMHAHKRQRESDREGDLIRVVVVVLRCGAVCTQLLSTCSVCDNAK